MKRTESNAGRYYKALAVTGLAILLGFGSVAHALAPGAAIDGAEESLIVRDSGGAYIGTVSNALQDQTGNILFVILSLGGGPGQVEKVIAVPLNDFSYDHHDGGSLVVNISREQLSAAPEFNSSALDDPYFAARVYRYFGQSPTWTD